MTSLSSVKKSLQVLQAFSAEQPERSVTEISRFLNAHKSSVSRILATLATEGFVEKNPLNSKYRLGLKLLELANQVLGRYELRDLAASHMEALAQETGEIVHLAVLDKADIVYLEKKGGGQTLTVATKVGGRNPAHASAMGKVLLSGLPSEDLDDLLTWGSLARLTPRTIIERGRLLKELRQVREQGFAVDDEESFPGIRCVAAPIRGAEGRVIAAISVTVPKQRMRRQRMEEIGKNVIKRARLISECVVTGRLEG
jgi:IclR family KDG regulon transcriptional repressor